MPDPSRRLVAVRSVDAVTGVDDRLAEYRRRRDFARTPEPSGDRREPDPPGDRRRFSIQQHDATRLHWDLRLEHEGVLWSWAMPRGVPWSPDENRLAVRTEDHPMQYLDWQGSIPAGEYGGGHMVVWDHGTYDLVEHADGKVKIVLDGGRVQGRFALFRTRGRDWMIHRMDPPQDPDRRFVPDGLRPMGAVAAEQPPEGDGWAHELRWRGARALLTNEGGRVTIVGADGSDLGPPFPEVRRIGRQLAAVETVLDGVIVAVDGAGRPRSEPGALDRRLGLSSDAGARRVAASDPAAFLAVDLLWLEGHPTWDLAWAERRTLLEELALDGPAWRTPSVHRGDGALVLVAARDQGLPGVVSKWIDSPYRCGATTDAWVETVLTT